MIREFLRHQWLKTTRSPAFGRELSVSIFLGFILFIFFINAVTFAFALPKLITENDQIDDPIHLINLGLVYYFMGELIMRYFLQKTPVLDIGPYLHLPIKRSTVATFLLARSLFYFLNLLALILVLPFAIKVIALEFGSYRTLAWLGFILFTSLSFHFFMILFKKKLENIPVVWVVLVLLIGGNYILHTYYGIDLLAPIARFFYQVLNIPGLIVIPVGLFIMLLLVSYGFYSSRLYIEDITDAPGKKTGQYTAKLNFLENDLSGSLMLQEIKLIIRHKRTRSLLILSLVFVTYGLLFFGREPYGEGGFLIFVAVLMSGLLTIQYGQFFWSWNTNQLDFFFTRPILPAIWLHARHKLLTYATIIYSVLCLPYAYFGWDVLLLLLCGALYNLGVNIPLIMRLSMWGPKPLDLSKSSLMNYQGVGAAQFIMGLPLLVGPYIFYVPARIFFGHIAGVIFMGVVGLTTYMFKDYFINLLLKRLGKYKYKMIHELTI